MDWTKLPMMPMIFALVLLTSNGVHEQSFKTMEACEKALSTLKSTPGFCVEKESVNIDASIDHMFKIMTKMKQKIDESSK